jgi:hypothetical protein
VDMSMGPTATIIPKAATSATPTSKILVFIVL